MLTTHILKVTTANTFSQHPLSPPSAASYFLTFLLKCLTVYLSVSPDIYPLIHHHSTLAETSSCFSGCLLVGVSADLKLPDSPVF